MLLTSTVNDRGNRCALFHQKESCALESAEFMCAGSKVCGSDLMEVDGHMTDCGGGIAEPEVSFPYFRVFGEQSGTLVNLTGLVVGIHPSESGSWRLVIQVLCILQNLSWGTNCTVFDLVESP